MVLGNCQSQGILLIRVIVRQGPTMLAVGLVWMGVILTFLARLYESTESYCCHFDVSVGVTLKIYTSKFFMLWTRHCQVSYPVRGQVLFSCLSSLLFLPVSRRWLDMD